MRFVAWAAVPLLGVNFYFCERLCPVVCRSDLVEASNAYLPQWLEDVGDEVARCLVFREAGSVLADCGIQELV